MIMQAKVLLDLENDIRDKDEVTTKGLIRENNKRIYHMYHEGKHVMIRLEKMEQKKN